MIILVKYCNRQIKVDLAQVFTFFVSSYKETLPNYVMSTRLAAILHEVVDVPCTQHLTLEALTCLVQE